MHPGAKARYHDQEVAVMKKIKAEREKGRRVSGRFIRVAMRKEIRASLGNDEADKFRASPGWFNAFLRRNNLSLRVKSNSKSASLEQRLPKVKRWHARLRRRLHKGKQRSPKWGRWLPRNRLNVDQVPLTIQDAYQQTYTERGSRCGSEAPRKVTTNGRQLCSCVFVWRMIRRLGSHPQCWSFEDKGSGSHNKRKMPGTIGSRWSFSRRHGPMSHSTCGMHRSAFHFLLRTAKATSCSWTTLVRKPRTKLCRLTRKWRTPRFIFFQATKQDIIQPIDAGIGLRVKQKIREEHEKWMEEDQNLSKWVNGQVKAWERRVLITRWLERHGLTCSKKMRSPLKRLGWKQGASWQRMGVKMHWSVRKALSNTHFAMRMEAAKGMKAKMEISKASMSFYQTWKCCTLTALMTTTVNEQSSFLQSFLFCTTHTSSRSSWL